MAFDPAHEPTRATRQGAFERLVHALTTLTALSLTVGGYLALRAYVWRHDSEVVGALIGGAIAGCAVGALPALVYSLTGRHLPGLNRLIGSAARLGALVGAFIYGAFHALVPLSPALISEPPLQRALQGAVDGLVIGALVGIVAAFVNGRALDLRARGLGRFLVLFLLVLTTFGVGVWVGTWFNLPGLLPLVPIAPLLILLRLVISALDRRRPQYDASLPADPADAPFYDDGYPTEDPDYGED